MALGAGDSGIAACTCGGNSNSAGNCPCSCSSVDTCPRTAGDSPCQTGEKAKACPNRKRPFDAHVWFSEAEQRKLERRVEQSGLSKGVFIRKAALENPIVIDPEKEKLLSAVTKMTAELKYIHAELGRQGGLLKMAIKPNEGQRQAHPEEWNLLVQTNHDLVRTQKLVWKTMEVVNGYFKAHQL